MAEKCEVLNLEWSSAPCRDRTMSTLVCNYLRYHGVKVAGDNLFNSFINLWKYSPKILLTSNSTGARENLEMVKLAKKKGITVITMVSEGNYHDNEDLLDQTIWGWNEDKILYEDCSLLWSVRTLKQTLGWYPELEKQLKVSGGVGFDSYKIFSRKERDDFLKKYNKNSFKKVIGVGCWDFGAFTPDDHRYESVKEIYTEEEIQRRLSDRDRFQAILKQSVEKNPDTLFILKQHPGVMMGEWASGIEGLDSYKNTLILKYEEPVIDCIAVSDFWLVYDSTTAMEAWLLGKESCMVNPSGEDFTRDHVHAGSACYTCEEELNEAIKTFYREKKLPGFQERMKARQNIIERSIQFEDGMNHVRAGNAVLDKLKELKGIKNRKNTFFSGLNLYWLKFTLRWYLSPLIPRYREFYNVRRKTFTRKQLHEYEGAKFREQIRFYENKEMDKKQLRKIQCLEKTL